MQLTFLHCISSHCISDLQAAFVCHNTYFERIQCAWELLFDGTNSSSGPGVPAPLLFGMPDFDVSTTYPTFVLSSALTATVDLGQTGTCYSMLIAAARYKIDIGSEEIKWLAELENGVDISPTPINATVRDYFYCCNLPNYDDQVW